MIVSKEAKDRIIVALDVPTMAQAYTLVQQLRGSVGAFKVGLELLTAEGVPSVIRMMNDLGVRIFLDGKFCDIPNTIAGASRSAASHGLWMFNLHASAGAEAIAAAVANKGESLVIVVTVLTSLTDARCEELFGSPSAIKVQHFAKMAATCRADGVVCSPIELSMLRSDPSLGSLLTVVPGIRPTWAAAHDQARIMTPSDAIRAGASYLVIGRPILQPPAAIGGPTEAARLIAQEIEASLSDQASINPQP